MIAVIDYDAGNLYSVANALKYLGARFDMTGDPAVVAAAEKVILPGVGSARAAMSSLNRQGLVEAIQGLRVPFLGICLGLQVLFEESEEDACPCLGLIPGRVQRFDSTRVKVPHIGWNRVVWRPTPQGDLVGRLVDGLPVDTHFYFVHSYYAPLDDSTTTATSEYDVPFSAAVRHDNFVGVQFHPERSGEWGLRLLRNFVDL